LPSPSSTSSPSSSPSPSPSASSSSYRPRLHPSPSARQPRVQPALRRTTCTKHSIYTAGISTQLRWALCAKPQLRPNKAIATVT
jgi:hypothetical protein